MISFSHISLTKGKTLILDDVSFEVAPGEFVCIVGESGSGKTSLCQLLLVLEKPSKGIVSVDDIDLALLPPRFLQVYRQSIGYLPQEDFLLTHETIAANIALPLNIRGMPKGEIEKHVAAMLLRLQLLEKAASYPQTLTQSERKKAALARALIGAPAILLADEPVSNLNATTSRTITTLLREQNRRGTTVILATASATLAENLGGRILALERGKLVPDRRRTPPPPLKRTLAPHTRIIPSSV